MELRTKQAYKQTEVGVIPEDWELIRLREIFSFHSTSNFSKAQMTEDDEVGCIHYGLIHAQKNTHFDLENGVKYYVPIKAAKYESVRNGDVIMVDASEDLDGLNKSVEVFGVRDKRFISGLHTYLLRDKNSKLADKFRGQILNSQIVKNQMLQLAVGMKVFGVSKTQLVNILLPLPPTHTEQKAIATALSDVDALISSLEKLIAKKKAIKQGVMQILFKDINLWETKKIKDFGFDISDGNYSAKYPKSSEFKSSGIPFIRANNIKNMTVDDNDMRFISTELHAELTKGHLKKGDILITNRGDIGQTAIVPDKFVGSNINAQIVRINSSNKLNRLFLFYFLRFNPTQNIIQNMQTGSALKQLPVNKLMEIEIKFPSEKEQRLIGETLLDIDKEMEQIETKKAKYQNIKQGMMQELLTGKIRLV